MLEEKKYPDFIGHDLAERELFTAFACGRIPHAWIFSGLKGIGKANFAFRVAYLLIKNEFRPNEERRPHHDTEKFNKKFFRIDTSDSVYRSICELRHPQFLYISPTTNIKDKFSSEIMVENVRKVSSFLRLTSRDGGWRVIIIDGAEQMNRSAQNTLLKLVEEPPNAVLIILISHRAGQLLPTLVSRCRSIVMKPLKLSLVREIIRQNLPDTSVKDIETLALLSDGSPGYAINLMEGDGLELYLEIRQLFSSMPKIDDNLLNAFSDRFSRKNNYEMYRVTLDIIHWWLSNIIVSAVKGKSLHDLVKEDQELISNLGSYGVRRWLFYKDKLDDILNKAETLHLDKSQIIFNFFADLRQIDRSELFSVRP